MQKRYVSVHFTFPTLKDAGAEIVESYFGKHKKKGSKTILLRYNKSKQRKFKCDYFLLHLTSVQCNLKQELNCSYKLITIILMSKKFQMPSYQQTYYESKKLMQRHIKQLFTKRINSGSMNKCNKYPKTAWRVRAKTFMPSDKQFSCLRSVSESRYPLF